MNRDNTRRSQTRQRYLDWTKDHRMTILRDDGVCRNIRVDKPGTYTCLFNITTIPGYLFFTGDMGSYVFSQGWDVFTFLCADLTKKNPTIDYDHFARKCTAADTCMGLEVFSQRKFKALAFQAFKEHEWPDGEMRMAVWQEDFRPILEDEYSDARDAIQALNEFYYQPGTILTVVPFADLVSPEDVVEPSLSFKLACWAIAYTIRDYDLGGDKFTRQATADESVLRGRT